jgi:2-polyprenyl-3-methyl-5-hydroxy-6-metoxy-1,4-benzoquinol methylase
MAMPPREIVRTEAELEQVIDRRLDAKLAGLVNAQPQSNTDHLWTETELRRLNNRWLSENLAGLVNAQSHPSTGELWCRLRDLDNIKLNIKFLGYELAKASAAALPPSTGLSAHTVGLSCKPPTQSDLESDWAAYWAQELQRPRVFNRRLWQLVYVLQAIHESGHLRAGARGLGFGCGAEPIASYLASRDVYVTATDLPMDDAQSRGWIGTGQQPSRADASHKPNLLSREQFDRQVEFRDADMSDIPEDLRGYDFCWSICALEHLGSIKLGLDFIENSLLTLRSGGIAVHTTEFNFLNDEQTIDDWPTVLFQKKHFRDLAEHLQRQGHTVAPLDFDVGAKPLDRFIDVPPYASNWSQSLRDMCQGGQNNMKLSVDGFACTCFGLIVRKA